MTCEILGILGFCFNPTQAAALLVGWTVLVAFLGRLVMAWAVGLALRHATVTLGISGLIAGLELFRPGSLEGLMRFLLGLLGGGG